MIIHDKKNAIQTIMKRRSEKGGPVIAGPSPMAPEVSMDEGGEVDPRHAAAQDMIMAMHEKSAEKYSQAMGNFMDMHMARGDADAPEADSEE